MRCEIFVRDYYGKTISVRVDSIKELKNMTVEELKRRVCHENEEYDDCRIIYAGRQLEHHTLGYYGVSNESTMHKTLRLRGGDPLSVPPDEDEGVPRTVSMENLADMEQEDIIIL